MTAVSIDLGAWREAAVRGDLPEPTRTDRWQPLRAGIVNLWEYDLAEVWYADGRMQLQGANESGKSTLMTLTTLLLLAGDISSRNIDTLGESSKRFRYYIEPTSHPLDRRDAGQQKHRGWAWLEYGRLTDDGADFFTTLLFAETRRADNQLRRQWCTVRGVDRVRGGLSLVNAGFVAEPKHLAALKPHPSGTSYRDEIARVLFGTDAAWLDQVVRILRVVRTPKIGDRLNLDFLTDAFRAALPPLADDEIHQLAEGWEQLERMRNERDTTEQALAAVTEFARGRWRPWADAVVRAAADPVTHAASELTGITRQESTAKQVVEDLASIVTDTKRQIGDVEAQRDRARAERDALRERQEYQDAMAALSNAEQLAERAVDAQVHAERSALRAATALTAIESAQHRLAQARRAVADAEAGVDSAADHVAERADGSGLIDPTARFLPSRDIARLRQAATQRDEQAEQALRLLRAQALATAAHDRAVDDESRANTSVQRARTAVDDAARSLETAISAVAELLAEWTARLDERIRPAPALVEAWARQVAAIADAAGPTPTLAAAIERDHLGPTRRPFEQRVAELGAQIRDLTTARQASQTRLAVVRAETDPQPHPPELWRRRERPAGVTALGAPLWRLVETADDLSAEQIAVLEATLDASGLLQAWVTTDGAYLADRDGDDTVWLAISASPIEASLRAVLRPADDAGELAQPVDRLLRTAAYGAGLSDDGDPALAADGRWRQGPLTGRAAPSAEGARLLGAAARAADRQRRIAALEAELERISAEIAELERAQDTVAGLLSALADAAGTAPHDSLVVTGVLSLRKTEADAAAADEALAQAQAAERQARDALAAAVATAAEHAEAHQLPRSADDVDALRRALAAYLAAVLELGSALRMLPPLVAAARQADEFLGECRATHDQATADADDDRRRADQARAKAEAARAALSQDGQALLDRFDVLGRELDGFDQMLAKLGGELTTSNERRVRAETQLEQVEQRRREAENRRQQAVDGWFACIDSGLPRLRDLPDPPVRHVTAALESARAARAAVSPRDWPDDPAAADQRAHRVQTLWSRMVDAVAMLRSRLESLSGRTVRTVVPGDGDDAFPGAVEIVVDGTGVAQPPPTAVDTLTSLLARLQTDYDEELTKTINQLLGSTFIEHLRERLIESERLRHGINARLAENPMRTSGLTLRLAREPVAEEHDASEVLTALERGFTLLPEATQDQIRGFLANRVSDAQEQARAAGDPDWRTRLAEILDYRRWFRMRMDYRAGTSGDWRRLDRDDHSLLSGGAKVVTLLQPFVAALHAMYDQSGVGPRMIWLDEAFDGVDPENRASLFRLLNSCDLDWLIAGPGPIVNAPTVPIAALYEVRRAPRPHPGVALDLAVWSGTELTHVLTPDPADLPDHRAVADDPADEPDLFSA